MATTPNWDAIKAEFIAGTSQRQLAEKYGVTRAAIAKRSQVGEWMKYRNECRYKTSQKVAETISDERAELSRKALELGVQLSELSKRVLDRLSDEGATRASGDGTELDALKTVQAWATMAKSLGVDAESTLNQQRLELERERLQLERERAALAESTEESTTIVIRRKRDGD